MNDVLTTEEVNEIASAPPSVTKEAIQTVTEREEDVAKSEQVSQPQSSVAAEDEKRGYATLRQDGKIDFEEIKPDTQQR